MPANTAPNRYRSLAIVIWLVSLLGAMLLCWPTVAELYAQWATVTGHYSHGALLLALGTYFVWSYRHGLHLSFGLHSYLGAAVFLGGYVLWQLADLGNVLVIQYVGMTVLIAGLWLALFGWLSIRDCLWRFSIVGLALPVWDVFNGTLQTVAGYFVGRLLALAGVPHHLEDTFVTLPNGAFEIAGGCSGLGFLMTGLSLAFYLIATSRPKTTHVLVVTALSIAVALVTNWVRIAIIIYVGYQSDMTSNLVADHLWVGWLAFALLAFPLFLLLSSKLPQVIPPASGKLFSADGWLSSPIALLAISVVGVVMLRAYFSVQQTPPSENARVAIDASTDPSNPVNVCSDKRPSFWNPTFKGLDLHAEAALCMSQNTPIAWLDVAYYANEMQGKELVFHENDPFGIRLDSERGNRRVAGTSVNAQQFSIGSSHYLIWQWYQVGDQRLAGDTETKIAQIKARFRQRSSAMSIALLERCSNAACSDTSLAKFAIEHLEFRVVDHGELSDMSNFTAIERDPK